MSNSLATRGRIEVPDLPSTSVSWSARHNTVFTAAATCLTPIAYLIFVACYAKNILDADDWSVVPLVDDALHGHLTLSALWAQHTDNRMLFPNLVFVGLGNLTRDNTIVVIAFSAAVFIASYAVFLLLYRSYQPLRPLPVLTIGIVWFSIADYQNAIWAFQFAWYLVLFCLVGMLYFLQRGWLVAALALTVIASFSSLQGLLLWPVGIIWLIWPGWNTRVARRVVVWLGCALVTTVVYFWNFNQQSIGLTWRHSVTLAEFVLVELGEVIPGSSALWLHELGGLVLLVAAGYVVVQSVRHHLECLPVALIAFGLLFDGIIALGRVEYALFASLRVTATPSRYTMPNLLILLAVVAYAWAHTKWKWVVAALVACQLVVATASGLTSSSAIDQHLVTGARFAVNLDKIPTAGAECYRTVGFFDYVYVAAGVNPDRDVALARSDHLSEFSDSQKYRGFPAIPACAPK